MALVSLRINGTAQQIDVDPATPLVYVLRNHFGLTGTKLGCGLEQCGSCMVLVDGKAQPSCSAPVGQFEGAEIVTVEGLIDNDTPGPVQQAFVEEAAAQCGYCTPGLVMAARALLDENPRPTPEEIKRGLSGNLCRCGAYCNVVNAVLDASGQKPIRDPGGR